MKKILINFLILIFFLVFISCKEKYHRGDFTIIVEKDKYEALGGALKINSYNVLYKGKEIIWGDYADEGGVPEIWGFNNLEFNDSSLLVEASKGSDKVYYLLNPNGDDVRINYIENAAYREGMFESNPYSDLLDKDLLFHQAGILINLRSLKKDSALFQPGGRLLATDKDFSNIFYINGIFDDDPNLKKTLDNAYSNNYDYYVDQIMRNCEKLEIVKWDVKHNKTKMYNYTDTALCNRLNKHYESKYSNLSTSYDSSFIFSLFKWQKDSIGELQLIPKNADIKDIQFIEPH